MILGAPEVADLEKVGPKGYEHGWIYVGVRSSSSPSAQAKRVSANVLARRGGSTASHDGHVAAARMHRAAAKVTTGSKQEYHSKMASIHSRAARGTLSNADAKKEIAAFTGAAKKRFPGGARKPAKAGKLPKPTHEERMQLAKEGKALPNGSYYIRHEKDLHNAVSHIRLGHGDVESAKKLVARRAKELGMANPLTAVKKGWSFMELPAPWYEQPDAFSTIDADYELAKASITASVVKVGPEGFIHGWIKVGSPAHDEFQSNENRGLIARHLDAASQAHQAGNSKEADSHLGAAHSAAALGGTKKTTANLTAAINQARDQVAPGAASPLASTARGPQAAPFTSGMESPLGHTGKQHQVLKVGPHGYVHGWVHVGAPGTAAHDRALNELGGLAAPHSQEAADAIDRARTDAQEGRFDMARGHLNDASFLLTAAGRHHLAEAAAGARDSFGSAKPPARGRPSEPVTGTRQPLSSAQEFAAALNMPSGLTPVGSMATTPVMGPARKQDIFTADYELTKQQIQDTWVKGILANASQFTSVMAADEVKAGPKGYVHGWIKVSGPMRNYGTNLQTISPDDPHSQAVGKALVDAADHLDSGDVSSARSVLRSKADELKAAGDERNARMFRRHLKEIRTERENQMMRHIIEQTTPPE